MKKGLVVLLLLAASGIAQADVFARAKNKAGGEIVLMTSGGNCPDRQMQMFSRLPTGEITQGCWFFDSPYVYAKYNDGTMRVYDGGDFTISEKYSTKKGKQI